MHKGLETNLERELNYILFSINKKDTKSEQYGKIIKMTYLRASRIVPSFDKILNQISN